MSMSAFETARVWKSVFPLRIRMRIALYITATILISAAAVAAFSFGKAYKEQQAIRSKLLSSASAMSSTLELEVHAAHHLLRGLATSPALRNGDLESFLQQLLRTPVEEDAWFTLLDKERYLLTTYERSGSLPLTRPRTLEELRGQTFKVSGRKLGVMAQRDLVGVQLVIRDQQGDLKYVLHQTLSNKRFEKSVREILLPQTWFSIVLDREGRPIVDSRATKVMLPQDNRPFNVDLSPQRTGFTRADLTPDMPVVLAHVRSDLTGWTIIAGAPATLLRAPMKHALNDTILAALGLAALGLLGCLWTARNMREPLEELQKTATDATCLLRENEKRLSETEMLYQTNWDHSAEALYIIRVRENGRFEYVRINPATERLTGLTNAKVRGKTPHECLPSEAADVVTRHYRECVAAGIPTRYEQDLDLPGGRRSWASQLAPVFDDATGRIKLLVGCCRDITRSRSAQREIHDLSDRLLKLQEEERQRIAVELHDSTSQHLTAAGLNLMALRQKSNAVGASRLFRDIEHSLDEAQKEIRAISYLLYPAELEREGMRSALESYVKGFSARTGLKTILKISKSIETLSIELQRAVLRIVQEALANTYRHAEASRISLTLEMRKNYLRIHIADDGKGFPAENGPGQKRASCGVGVPGMRARVKQFGGRLRILRGRKGASIHACIPLSRLPKKTSAVRAVSFGSSRVSSTGPTISVRPYSSLPEA